MSTENEKYLASLAHKGNHNFDLFHGSYEVIETARYNTSLKAIYLEIMYPYKYSRGKKYRHPHYTSPIEMRSL